MREPIRCTTEQFAEAMCNHGFVRTSRTTGRLGLDRLTCDTPPEEVPGFLAAQGREIMTLLGASKHELARYDAAVNGLPPPPRPFLARLWDRCLSVVNKQEGK